MANYATVKAQINANIKNNNNQEITGAILNGVLLQMVQTLADGGYIFGGVAALSTNPGTPDAKVFYLAAIAGTYTHFGSGLTLLDGECGVFTWDGSWTKTTFRVAPRDLIPCVNVFLPASGGRKIDLSSGTLTIPNAGIIFLGNGKSLNLSDLSEDVVLTYATGGGAYVCYYYNGEFRVLNRSTYHNTSPQYKGFALFCFQGGTGYTNLPVSSYTINGEAPFDSVLSPTSSNAVKNRVVYTAIQELLRNIAYNAAGEELQPVQTYPKSYLNAQGVPTSTSTSGANVNEYEYAGKPVLASGFSPGSTNVAVAYFSAANALLGTQKFGTSRAFTKQPLTVPTGTAYFRVMGNNTQGTNQPYAYIGMLKLTATLEKGSDAPVAGGVLSVNIDNNFDGVSVLGASDKILGLGASFMRNNTSYAGRNNTWFEQMCSKVGCLGYNDADGGTNICYHANRLFSGAVLGPDGDASIDAVAAVLIMHTHNKDVFTLADTYANYTVADYEANVLPFSTTTGSTQTDSVYARAFDYVIKKLKALFFAKKLAGTYASEVQSIVGTNYVKAPQIVLCTHWHDARTVYNDSVRKLAQKWGLPLVQFDRKIGFTKDKVNPAYGAQESIQYTGSPNTTGALETIDGVQYGWHPMCGDGVYIQKKLAAIAAESFEVI